MLTLLKRIIKNGWKSFVRNIGFNIATIFIMIMVISLITFLFLFRPASQILISDLQEKVDISVYFKKDILTEEMMAAKTEISRISEVKKVEYVSREQALEKFIEKHKDDPVLMESLTEVGENPFLASLNIKAWQASQYQELAKFLETGPFKNLIDKVDYYQRKSVIDKVSSLSIGINKIGIFFSLIFGLIAILVAFNTIRLAIYNSKEELSIMRLVGASNWFVRGPFLVQGAVVGFIASLATLLIFFGISFTFDSKIKEFVPEISIFSIFLSNFWTLFLIQIATGVGLGIISGLIAIRKYLKI